MDLGVKMSIKDLKKISPTTEELARMQSNLENWAASVQKSGLSNGVLLSGILLNSSIVNNIEHKLGRQLQGWIVVGQNVNAQIWDNQDANTFKTKFLALRSSANVTVNLWVF